MTSSRLVAALACTVLVGAASATPAVANAAHPSSQTSHVVAFTATKPRAATAGTVAPLQVSASFGGLAQGSCGCYPYRSSVAASDTEIVQVADARMLVTNKSGAAQATRTLADLTNDTVASGFGSSWVTYDALYGRWVIAATYYSAGELPAVYIIVSTSGSAASPSAWKFLSYAIDQGDSGGVAENVMIGSDQDAFAFTADYFDQDPTNLAGVVFTAAKAQLFNNSGVRLSDQFSIPAHSAPAVVQAQDNRLYILSADATANQLTLRYLTDTSKTPYTALRAKGTVPYSFDSPFLGISQPGGNSLVVARGGFEAPVTQVDNRLWFAHTVNLHTGTKDFSTIDWGFVNVSSLNLSVAHAYQSGQSDDFAASIAVLHRPGLDNVAVLSWSYVDPSTPVTNVYAISIGNAVTQKSGKAYSVNPAVTVDNVAAQSGSVAVDQTPDTTCNRRFFVVSGINYSTGGTPPAWKSRIARVAPNC